MRLSTSTLSLLSGLAGCAAASAAAEIDFNRDIRPILSSNCFECHGPDAAHRKADLRLDSREGAIEDRDGVRAIDPDNLADSEFIYRLTTEDADELMPPPKSKKKITPEQVDLLKRWVLEGGQYDDHWAFVPPVKSAPPEVQGRVHHPIDQFVIQRARAAGLQQSPAAERGTWLRRVTYDLTGLPPSPGELDDFLADKSPQAFEKVVDRLLASPQYGERMALAWMDAARYGDSSVMHADGPRDMWAWRDWVIRAYNDNMPFDQFTIEQIGGDLLPNATIAQRVASGFNRNHATSDEGGAFPEELRVEYVVDRVKTTANVWMGLSMECGQCHDHKYDPISQREYYAMFAYFNNTTDPGMQTRNGNQAPIVEVPAYEQQEELAQLTEMLERREAEIEAYKRGAVPEYVGWLRKAEQGVGDARPEAPGLAHYFPLNETGGKTISAGVGGGTGTLAGNLQSAERDGDKGLKFNGKTAFTFADWPARERDKPFTFAAWLKMGGNGSGSVIARMDEGAAYRGYDLWVQGRAVGVHIIHNWNAGNALKVVSDRPLQENRWQHVAVTYDGSSKAAGVKIYIDGELVGNKVEKDGLKDTIATATPFKVGSRSRGGHYSGEADEIRIYDRVLSQQEVRQIGGDPIKGLLATPAAERTREQKMALLEHYLSTHDEKYQGLLTARAEVARRQNEITGRKKTTSMVMQDNPDNRRRVTYVLNRGQYDQPIKEGDDAEILPGVPASLPPLPEGAPENRLGLARWLVSEEHPLTARVAVNRYWAMLFGRGLVKTVGDFGNQGTPPTNRALLDWLAVDFMESGWDVKRMIRNIVLSATYRQHSRVTPELLAKDPENILLARSPRFRLQGEFIRDTALAVSGLLVGTIGGPSVKPYQPPNIWNEVSLNGGLRYPQDKGEKLYRRSMYTYWKRSAPMPNMLIFDAPTREKCMIQRPVTNTPLQALVTLNDPQWVEAARAFAQRLIKEGGEEPQARIEHAFRLALARPPSGREIQILTGVLDRQMKQFEAEPERANQLLGVGESPRDASIPAPEHAAWTVLCQMVLNMDETLTRG